MRLPGSSANTGCAMPSFSCSRASRLRGERRSVLRERMPDESHRHARLPRRSAARTDKARESGPPRGRSSRRAPAATPIPPGSTKCMVRSAGALQLVLEPEIEIGRVDTDEHAARVPRRRRRASARADAEDLRQPRYDLGYAADRQRFQRVPRLATRRLHLRTRNADEARVRETRAHGRDQYRCERVAGRFSGGDSDGDALRSAGASPMAAVVPTGSTDDAAVGRGEEIDERTQQRSRCRAASASAALASSSERPSR